MFLQQLINGLLLGSMYSLIAIGYTLVFGVLNLLNLAHGEIFMIGGFVGLFLVVQLNLPIFVSVLGAMAGAGLCGILLEISCFRFVKSEEYPLAPVLATVGFGLVLSHLANIVSGSEPRVFPLEIDLGNLEIGSLIIPNLQLVMLGFALLLMVTLSLLINRTEIGRLMRAVAENPRLSHLVGINARRVTLMTFIVSSALGGTAGILVGMRMGKISPFIGSTIGLKALAVMIIGGLGNINGSMFAGIIIGVLEVLTISYFSSAYVDGLVWVILILLLLFRPSGLFGSQFSERI